MPLVLVLLVLHLIYVNGISDSDNEYNYDFSIPEDISQRLKGIRTHEDFLKRVNVIIPKSKQPVIGASVSHRAKGNQEASIISVLLPGVGHGWHAVDQPETTENIEQTQRYTHFSSKGTTVSLPRPGDNVTIPPIRISTYLPTTPTRFGLRKYKVRVLPKVKAGTNEKAIDVVGSVFGPVIPHRKAIHAVYRPKPALPTLSTAAPGSEESLIDDHDEIINEPVQSDDSCHAVKHCFPLPLDKKQGHYYFPECIDIHRCLGGCCDHRRSCYPTKVNVTAVKVRTYRFIGQTGPQPDFRLVNEGYVRVERHISCGCSKCSIQTCPVGKHWEDCQCICDNHKKPSDCAGTHQEWSDDHCDCRCKSLTCGPSQFLDPDSCRCEKTENVTEKT